MRRLALPLDRSATGPVRPGAIDRWFAARLQATISPAAVQVQLWDGTLIPLPGTAEGTLVVMDRRVLRDLVLHPDIAFGEHYTTGRLGIRGDFGSVVERLTSLARPSPPSLAERLALRLAPVNNPAHSRHNVHHHYDLGNDFYALWLDPQMLYTCAWYPTEHTTLADAQVAKLDRVCRKLQLRAGERVLEAGCGWGALALHMARHYGVTVRAYNISREQLRYARGRAAEEGLDRLVTFVDDDYRNATGRYDAFVSLGMLEHVGRRAYRTLSSELAGVLDPITGRGLLHFIGRDHPRRLNAWIRKRIFPGAYPPTLTEVTSQVLAPANLSVLHVENMRWHYARTLSDWRSRFEAAEATVRGTFGADFYRAWRLYLAGSEASFKAGWLQLFQVVFAPAGSSARAPRDADL